jgi:excisionase family DNA binding protein
MTTERLTVSVPEAAKLLGIARNSAYNAVHEGHIPHLKIGKRIVVPRVALERLLECRQQGQTATN